MKMPEENIDLSKKIQRGIEIAHKNLIKEKKEKGHDLIISENGRIVRIPPKDL